MNTLVVDPKKRLSSGFGDQRKERTSALCATLIYGTHPHRDVVMTTRLDCSKRGLDHFMDVTASHESW